MSRVSQFAIQQLSLPSVAVIFAVFITFLIGMEALEDTAGTFAGPADAASALLTANSLARSTVQLISVLLASLFLAVPLTANMYTPQLIELFVKSWTNRIVIGFFVFSSAHAVWLARGVTEDSWPRLHIALSLWLFTVSIVVLVPYLFFVFRFLDPNTIIRRVSVVLTRALEPRRRGTSSQRQTELARRIHQLGNIVLKAIDRGDRDVALAATLAMGRCAQRYLSIKARHTDEWFQVDVTHFPGLSREAIRLVNRERTWVEMEILSQLARAYDGALKKMPDVVSAVSRSLRHFAVAAAEAHDAGALKLAIRFFNNFLREAAKQRIIHALYDVIFQYRLLAVRLWDEDPRCVVSIARHLKYYGAMAAENGTPFAQDLVAYDLGAVLAAVRASEAASEVDDLLAEFLGIRQSTSDAGGSDLSLGVLKARIILASALYEKGDEVRAGRVEESLRRAPADLLRRAGEALCGDVEEWFWEVTDRQQNLDYVDGPQKQRIHEMLARLRPEPPGSRQVDSKDALGRSSLS